MMIVEEDRGGEAEGIDAIEDAAVSFDDYAEILNADVAFDRVHGDSTR